MVAGGHGTSRGKPPRRRVGTVDQRAGAGRGTADHPSTRRHHRHPGLIFKGDSMAFQPRRVVTGHDANGKAVVKMDSVPTSITSMRKGVTGCVAWTSDSVPVDLTDDGKVPLKDAGLAKVGTSHEE